jgi:hypothetical protein
VSHWQKYGRSYLIGFLFVTVAVATAFVGEFENMTAAQIQGMTRLQWAVAYSQVIISAGTTILAFLNQTIARAGQPVPPPGPSTSSS